MASDGALAGLASSQDQHAMSDVFIRAVPPLLIVKTQHLQFCFLSAQQIFLIIAPFQTHFITTNPPPLFLKEPIT